MHGLTATHSLRRWWSFFAAVAALLCLTGSGHAATVDGLYVGNARVTDSGEGSRQKGFIDALAQVLIKLSGRRDAPAKVGAGIKDAAKYVQRFGYLSGGRIEVGFDAASVNALLDQAGLPLWDRERPLVLVVYPVALQAMREAKATTELLAKQRGLPIVWASSETSDALTPAALAPIQALGQRYHAEAVLLARGSTAAELKWQVVFNGSSQESVGSAEEGPQLAADVLAQYYAVSGKATLPVVIDVAGISSVDAYGLTLNLFTRQLLVRSVALESLQQDVARFRLELRGTSQAFERALQLDKTLVPVTGASAGADAGETPLKYRFNAESSN